MKTIRIAAIIFVFWTGILGVAQGQDYVRSLVNNLLAVGYRLKAEDVAILNTIGMRFDSKNRIDVLEKILADRHAIHSLKDAAYFTKTEAICDALRLVDEHNLPEANALIDKLNKQEGWEKREKALLVYMAAKRDFDYQSNVSYLMESLPTISSDLEILRSGEISWAILDICNCLSYLAKLFVYKGDQQIVHSLIQYSLKSYGYPSEYLSHLFVDMLAERPEIIVPALAKETEPAMRAVITSLVFALWNKQSQQRIRDALQGKIVWENKAEKEVVSLLLNRLDYVSEDPAASAQ